MLKVYTEPVNLTQQIVNKTLACLSGNTGNTLFLYSTHQLKTKALAYVRQLYVICLLIF